MLSAAVLAFSTQTVFAKEGDAPKSYSDKYLNCSAPMGHHLSAREFTCPIGGEKYESLALGTHSIFGRYLDWSPVSYMQFPPPLPVCPSNGFVAAREYAPEDLVKLEKVITSDEYKKIYAGQHATFFLFAEQNRLAQMDEKERFALLMQATWEASNCNDAAKYRSYATLAIETGKEKLKTLTEKDNEYWMIYSVIPELYRRMGEFKQAQEWLDSLAGKSPANKEMKEGFDLAVELLKEAVTAQNSAPVELKRKTAK